MTIDFFKTKALEHSTNCFLNSLLKEWRDVSFTNNERVDIRFGKKGTLTVPVKKISKLGRHEFEPSFFLSTPGLERPIEFREMIAFVTDQTAIHAKQEASRAQDFAHRVFNSSDMMTLFLRTSPAANREPKSFKDYEQSLLVGHSFHPAPKSRDEFEDSAVLAYSPETGKPFALEWLMADPKLLVEKRAASAAHLEWARDLAKSELGSRFEELSALGLRPFPMHPWQRKVLFQKPWIQKLVEAGRLVHLGEGSKPWHATSSLRSLYRDDAPYMVKFSMSVKLTNSIRHLTAREVERGIQVRDVFASSLGQEFRSRFPQFEVITEPAYMSLKDETGEVMPESIVVCRENPFLGANAEGKAVLATLNQDALLEGSNLIQKHLEADGSDLSKKEKAKKWFRAYMTVALRPLVHAYADCGIVLGAHQQNLIFNLENGYPTKCYFRDCQGTGYTELGFKNFASSVAAISRENGNVVDQKTASYFFAYYFILNSTFNVISSLASQDGVSERELIEDLRLELESIRQSGVEDPACLDYLLDSSALMHKGNFFCSVKNINENTASDPFAIYTPIANPLRGKMNKKLDHSPGEYYRRFVPSIGKTISFRTIEVDRDLEIFHLWHNQPRVFDLWELNKTQEELKTYLENGLKDPHQIPLIMEVDGRPVGYFEIYWAAQDRIAPYYEVEAHDRGLHFLIGEDTYLGRANTAAAISSAMHMIFLDDERTQRIVAEPRADNKRVLKYIEIVPGWKFVKEFDFPHKRAALLMAKRADYFAGESL